MIVSGLVLFLFGTAVSAGPYIAPTPTEILISKNRHPLTNKVAEYYPSSNTSPFISNFIQKGTNVFFKPQFVLSAAQMPPQVQTLITEIEKDDCKTAYPMGPVPVMPIVEEPLRIIEKEIIASPEIKEVIEINPMAIPHAIVLPKAPVLIEEPCEIEQVIVPEAPVVPAYIPKVAIPAPFVPVVVEERRDPVVIPPAPVLPPLEMPRMPVMVEEVPFVAPVPEIPMVVEVEQPAEIVVPVIPPAPVLPPMDLPKVSMLVEEPCVPAEVIVEHMPQKEVVEIIQPAHPMVIPEAPVLPQFVPVEIPTPVFIEEVKPVSFEIEREIIEPAIIPPAPVLPPLEIPKMPVLVEETVAPVLPSYVPDVIISQPTPMVIPAAPELVPFSMPKLPVEVIVEEHVMPHTVPVVPCDTVEIIEEHVQPMVIPEAPLLPPMGPLELPTPVIVEVQKEFVNPAVLPMVPCDTVEVIEEHIMPMVIPAAPVLPPLAPVEIPTPVIIEEPISFQIQKELPPAPVLPPLPETPKVVVPVPCETVEIIEEHVQPVLIPEAPVLAPLAPLSIPAPIIVEESVKPVVLPPAPVLPPLGLPKAQLVVEKPAEVVVAPCPPYENEIIVEQRPIMPVPFAYSELSLDKPVNLPSAPMVSQFYGPYAYHNAIKEDAVMVEKHSLSPFPPSYRGDIIVERIVPKTDRALRTNAVIAPVPIQYAHLSKAVL